MFTAKEKLKAVEREIVIRQRVYPGRVQNHRMTQQQADFQLAIFDEIRQDYVALAMKETLL